MLSHKVEGSDAARNAAQSPPVMSLLRFASQSLRSGRGSSIFLRGARQVVTLQGPGRMRTGDELNDIGLIEDASLLIRDGVVVQVGSARRLEHLSEAASAHWVDARDLVIIPGYIDAVEMPRERTVTDCQTTLSIRKPRHGPLSRDINRSLQRLLAGGTTYCRCAFDCPEDPAERMRLLRQLLRVEQPVGSFQSLLTLKPATFAAEPTSLTSARDLLMQTQKLLWSELRPMLAAGFLAADLQRLGKAESFRLLRLLGAELSCVIRDATTLRLADILDLSLACDWLAEGTLPEDPATLAQLSAWSIPWLATVGESATMADASLARLTKAVELGMRLAIGTGYRDGASGVANPLALTALLHQQTGLPVAHLLQLQIANMAHALGAGNRMGSLETGKDANLLLLDCEDYRDIGRSVGGSQLVAVLRRGETEGRWSSLLAG
jgi:imidazolonepropionase